MNPKYPVYIVSKGRWESRLTAKALEKMKVPFHIVVEPQEAKEYRAVTRAGQVLVLDMNYKKKYDTYDHLGDKKSKGPGAARNFAWDHSVKAGYKKHWVMDDNISMFCRLNKNLKVPVSDGTIFRAMEDFVERYENVGMAGPNYFMFASRKSKMPPFVLNTRIYSCNLIDNALPFRWRGRYNEDTDLSLRILKAGLCTVQFNAFLQYKMTTQTVKGGNTKEFYEKEGTLAKSQMQVALHPDVSRLTYRFKRVHHYVDYSRFKKNVLIRRAKAKPAQKVNNYGMKLKIISG